MIPLVVAALMVRSKVARHQIIGGEIPAAENATGLPETLGIACEAAGPSAVTYPAARDPRRRGCHSGRPRVGAGAG